MKKLLAFEFRKLFASKSFYICTLLMMVLVVISSLITKFMDNMTGSLAAQGVSIALEKVSHSGIYTAMTANSGNNISLIIAIFTALFVCNDFSQGTIKNVISRGYTRTQVFASKLIAVLCAVLIMFIMSFLTGFLCGSIIWKTAGSFESSYISVIAAQIFAVAAMGIMFFAASALVPQKGAAIGIGIGVSIGVPILFSLLDLVIKSKKITLSSYWIDTALSNVSALKVSSSVMTHSVICAAVYFVLFGFLSWLFMQKKEV
jgi:ABC-2 type transport system permease protein